jgi:hypothetical protein
MKTRISRRLFLSGAALLGAGIALDQVGQVSAPAAEQGDGLDEESPKPTSAPGVATSTLVVTSDPVAKQEVVAVAAGLLHSLAVTRSGEVIAWGGNEYGQTSVPSDLRDVVVIYTEFY